MEKVVDGRRPIPLQFRPKINGANKNSCSVSLSLRPLKAKIPLEGYFPTLFGLPTVNEKGETKALRFITLREGVLRVGNSNSSLHARGLVTETLVSQTLWSDLLH